MRGDVKQSRILHALFSCEMKGDYLLAEVDLLLGLAVVWLGRHDGGYLWWCGVCGMEV